MKSILILAALAIAALPLPGAAHAAAPTCAIDQTVTVKAATNMVALSSVLATEEANGLNGANYASFPVALPAAGCVFHAEVVRSTVPLPGMSLHFFASDWKHLEPDGDNADQCDGKAPGTAAWTCPVTTPGIAFVVVDGNVGVDVTMRVTAAPI